MLKPVRDSLAKEEPLAAGLGCMTCRTMPTSITAFMCKRGSGASSAMARVDKMPMDLEQPSADDDGCGGLQTATGNPEKHIRAQGRSVQHGLDSRPAETRRRLGKPLVKDYHVPVEHLDQLLGLSPLN